MKFALDFDDCFTKDKILWSLFINQLKLRGHSVTFVTFRSDLGINDDILIDAKNLGIDIVFTNGKQKAGCFDADIWIDDSPVTIPKAEDLNNMFKGCVRNGDI